MKTKLIVFLLVVTIFVGALWFFEQNREPAKFSDVFFSKLLTSSQNFV